ncbi:Protein of unknown function [Thermobacillus xylanilyticus]|uniref:Uncharacterized protein n=1 Tax=Thermobacillus xylanilyticus TaxID=76633 RepID=A0ABN7S7X0_THEXY|nr:Protein of unknown function [Thermobacillus xylanilyticus]
MSEVVRFVSSSSGTGNAIRSLSLSS